MFNTPQFMREMKRGEEAAVDVLLSDAFGSKNKINQIAKWRKSRVIAGEMILPMDGTVIGYAALAKMPSPKGWLLLDPVAIAPEFQNRGFGKRLVGMIAQWAQMSGNTLVVCADSPLFRDRDFTSLPDHIEMPTQDRTALICAPAKTTAKTTAKTKIAPLTFPKT